ncbi:DNA primase [Vibrio owensii]|uniref:plasmid replication protein, CyRepA1 family n=1 Tax=Vibrio owensii TaxID=696485 RepID=UPI0010436947|nr:plasmid replication protein, CyRepA1 family [Vibrio owensii]TDE19250.1 DNA primase [Vibrio owensii]
MNKLELTLLEAEEALSFIDFNLPYNDWAKVGRALYSEFGDSARDIFESWSAQGSSYHKKEFNAWWKNFRKTRKTSFGSFIYMATEAGWRPERQQLDEQEYARRLAESEKRRKAAEAKRIAAEQAQWTELEKEQHQFQSWPTQFAPTGYMQEKQMADLANFADVRLGTDQYNRPFLAWPIFDELFNQGNFCGYEKIIDKRIQIGRRKLNKFSSDNARTDIGFITFGNDWVHGRKRAFVVGGLADAYSAHKSSGEVVLSPIGEGNIPGLIQLLQEKHPEVEFIAAPDNDKTGLEMIERAGGFWTLPQSEGKDWSDVYITEGHGALLQQLTNIRGFKTVVSNDRYLKAAIREGLNMLKSGMGTGKSTTIKHFIQKNPHLKTLIVSHRRALAKSLRKGIKDDTVQVEYYEDLIIKDAGKGVDANMALRNAGILVCSVDSLHRLAGSHWDVVFVDEIEQNLGHYFAETNRFGEHCLNYLTFALTSADYQILADAHLGDLTKAFCNRIGLQSGVIYDNQYKTGRNKDGSAKKLFVYQSKGQLTEVVMQQLMASGKRYIYANSKSEVKRIATSIEQERERGNYDGAVLVVHADVANDENVANALQDINAVVPELDVIVASPTLGTGFDISSDCHQFEKTIGFLSSRVGTSEEGHQGLNRARDVSEFHVYLDPAERSEPTCPDYIHSKLIEEVSAETMKVLAIDPTTGEYTSRNPLFEWLYCEVKAHQNESKNRYKARFLEIAEHDGYEIIQVSENEMAKKLGNTIREQANDRTKRELLRDIADAPVHIGEAFDNMMANGEDYTAVEIAKSKVVHDLNLDDATDQELDSLFPMAKSVFEEFEIAGENVEFNPSDAPIAFPSQLKEAVACALTYSQERDRYINAIKRLTWVNVNAETAKALDSKDVQHAESRVSWRHLSIRRSHLIKLLRVAGIDETLNYNGKAWTAEELNKELGPWLKQPKNKDRLFKYSNITVTPNTLDNPCKWLNSHLRSFGVPVVQSGKRRVNGVAVNTYQIDKDAWEGVRSLVAMRTRGIEASMQDESVDMTALVQNVTNLVAAVNNGEFKAGWNVLFNKLDKQCVLSGQEDLRDQLAQAYAQIADRLAANDGEKGDPLAPTVLYKSIGSSGSLPLGNEPSCDGAFANMEGREEDPQTAIQIPAPHTLSATHRKVVEQVIDIAVNVHNLPKELVVAFMVEEGLENFSSHPEAWATTISKVLRDVVALVEKSQDEDEDQPIVWSEVIRNALSEAQS